MSTKIINFIRNIASEKKILMKIEKKQEKVWWFQKNSVPLHPQFSKSADSKQNDAPVAQLVEHLTLNQGVQSSSLCGCTKNKRDEFKAYLFFFIQN